MSGLLDQWRDQKPPRRARRKDCQGSPAPRWPRREEFPSARFKPPQLRRQRCHGFATRHSRHRPGHHVREGRPAGGCTRPPFRVRSTGELRPGCEGRDRERGGRAAGEAALASPPPDDTGGAPRRSTPDCPACPISDCCPFLRGFPACAAQAKPLDFFAQGAFPCAGTDLPTLRLPWGPCPRRWIHLLLPITLCTLT